MIYRLWNFVRRDAWRKVMALFLASMLYLYILPQLNIERQISEVPVEIELADGLVMASPGEQFVTVVVRGPKHEIDQLSGSDIAGRVLVTAQHRTRNNRYIVPLSPENFRKYRRVRVTRLDERNGKLNLLIQSMTSKMVKIAPRFSGNLAPAFRQADCRSIPSEVQVRGPELTIEPVQEIFTEPIPLSESIEESFEYQAKLAPPRGIEVIPARVTVQVDIERNQELRSFPAIRISLLATGMPESPLEITMEPKTVAVTLCGTPEAVARLSADDLRVYVDVSKISQPGSYEIPVQCHVGADGIQVKALSPGDVKIKAVVKR